MKPIGNIFGFDCVTCEHNRNCYGGNMGNQFRYCQKSIEKVKNLDKLEQENKQLREKLDWDLQWALKYEKQVGNWNKLKEYMIKEQARIVIENTDEDEFVYTDLLNKMLELEKGVGNVKD